MERIQFPWKNPNNGNPTDCGAGVMQEAPRGISRPTLIAP